MRLICLQKSQLLSLNLTWGHYKSLEKDHELVHQLIHGQRYLYNSSGYTGSVKETRITREYMMVNPMFMIVQNSRLCITVFTPTAVAPTAVFL